MCFLYRRPACGAIVFSLELELPFTHGSSRMRRFRLDTGLCPKKFLTKLHCLSQPHCKWCTYRATTACKNRPMRRCFRANSCPSPPLPPPLFKQIRHSSQNKLRQDGRTFANRSPSRRERGPFRERLFQAEGSQFSSPPIPATSPTCTRTCSSAPTDTASSRAHVSKSSTRW